MLSVNYTFMKSQSIKALIVDDNPLDLSILSNIVRQCSEMEIVQYTSSAEALQWCRTNTVDLVILDCLMPSPNGIEFVYVFRTLKGKSQIPIIMVTASDEKEIKYQALQMGVNFFVKKPIDYLEFFVVIHNALSIRQNQLKIQERERQLAESEEKFRILAEKLPNMIMLFWNGQVTYANEMLEKTLGIKREELYRSNPEELLRRCVMPDSIEKAKEILNIIKTNPNTDIIPQEITLRSARGDSIIALVSIGSFNFKGQQAIICIATDITSQKEVERDLYESRRRLSTLINNLPGIAFRCKNDEFWTMQYMSEGCIELLGYRPEELINSALVSYNDLIIQEDRQRVWEVIQSSLINRQPYVLEYRVCDRNGVVKWVWEKGIGVYDEKDELIAIEGFITDITERKEAEKRLQYIAHYDTLTGLANRLLFFDRLNQAIRMAKRGMHMLALLYIDLDGFKFINDNYGHDAGDQVLKETAKRLLQNVRESDTVARMGGDEFTVILPKIHNKKSASIVAQKILHSLSEPYVIDKDVYHLSASIGISIYSKDEEDTDSLIKKADIAMYRSKQLGKNRYTFYSS